MTPPDPTPNGGGEVTICHDCMPQFRALRAEVARLEGERTVLAMLASDTPMFANPLHIVRAKELRDKVLESTGGTDGR